MTALLTYELDITCPLPKAAKPISATWPFPVAGPISGAGEAVRDIVKRRYWETLYLPDIFSPLRAFAADLSKVRKQDPVTLHEAAKPLLLNLSQIQNKHRKAVIPLLSAQSLSDEKGGVDEKEIEVIRGAMVMRRSSRQAVDDAVNVLPSVVGKQIEQRETFIQLILALTYLNTEPPKVIPDPSNTTTEGSHTHKKRKRIRNASHGASIVDDPETALELLLGQLSIWQFASDLGLAGLGSLGLVGGTGGENSRADEESNLMVKMCRDFWDEVLVPFFLQSQSAFLQSYHLKVFHTPAPADLIPPKTSKKPRKPKLTRALPSAESGVFPVAGHAREEGRRPSLKDDDRGRGREAERKGSVSRAPSEVSVGSIDTGFRRSLSRVDSQSQSQSASFRRSRSRSIDTLAPAKTESSLAGLVPPKRSIHRAQSGKDLFKNREVGLRRAGSKKAEPGKGLGFGAATGTGFTREDSQSQLFGGRGLMGRKVSGEKVKKSSTENEDGHTLIMATPVKPRLHKGWQPHPTPIQEEPSSISSRGSRPTFAGDTPLGPGRGFVAETPVAPGRMGGYVAETPVAPGRMSGPFEFGSFMEDEGDEEGLGELMVMTDDEEEEEAGRASIPETPVK